MEKFDKTTRKQYRTKVEEGFPDTLLWGPLEFKKILSMRYGENPGYPAAFYQEPGASGPNMASIEVLQEGTKGLSYINIGDMDLGLRLVRKLSRIYPNRRICALVKHEMPSGVAMGQRPAEVFAKAWGCDQSVGRRSRSMKTVHPNSAALSATRRAASAQVPRLNAFPERRTASVSLSTNESASPIVR